MSADFSVSLSSARRLRMIDASRWIGHGSAFWLEWDHPLEQSRTFEGIMQGLMHNNWHKLIPPGCTCVDIGAHSGDTSIPMGLFTFDKQHNQRGRVIVIEPNPDLVDILTACLTLNAHVADFYLEKVAIASIDGLDVEMHDHGNANCNGGLIADYSPDLKEHLVNLSARTYRTRARSLPSIIESHSRLGYVRDVRFIKMDCEGYDKEIVKSSRDYLMQAQPALYVEWFAMFGADDDQDFINTFDEIAYELFNPATLTPVKGENRPFDVIAVPKGRLLDYIAG